MKKLLLTLLQGVLILVPYYSWGQLATVEGKVFDKESGETLIGVNIILEDQSGTASDEFGNYKLEVPEGSHILTFSYIGYKKFKTEVIVNDGDRIQLETFLDKKSSDLDVLVVSGSLFEKRLEEETMSIDVVPSELIRNTNSVTLADAALKAPGVYFMDEQINIRGGTGFTYGAGSRVMVVVDDQPMLAADRGDVKWSYIPMEITEQIEVIKGASSVLYGSSALNGVMHVRTSWPGSKPESQLTIYSGLYEKPKEGYKAWWQTPPGFAGANFSHMRKYDQVDLVMGGHFSNNMTHLEGQNSTRARFNFKTRYRPSWSDKVSYGLNGNIMYDRTGIYFLWVDNDSGQYRPFGGNLGEELSSNLEWSHFWLTLDPYVNIFDNKDGAHYLKMRYYRNATVYSDSTSGRAYLMNFDYRYHKMFKRNIYVTTGFSGFTFNAKDDQLGDHDGFIGGFFFQVEKKFFNRLSLNIGTRMEFYKRDTVAVNASSEVNRGVLEIGKSIGIPIFKAGLNYIVNERTFLRGSFGQGFRVPSLVELYSETSVGILQIFSNPDLSPEYGWNAEIGLKKSFGFNGWTGYADLAAYWTEYFDMTEFVFGIYESVVNPTIAGPGFKSINLNRARIAGLELTVAGKGKIKNIPFNVIGGYNYIYPADLIAAPEMKNVGNFVENFFRGFTAKDSAFVSTVLRYRFRHLFRIDAEAEIKKFAVGADISYYSFMENIDTIFTDFNIPPGIDEFRNDHNNGDLVIGARVRYALTPNSSLGVLVRNAFNREYALRPAKMDAPRNYTIQYRVDF